MSDKTFFLKDQFKECIDKLSELHERDKSTISELRKELDEYSKDDEIQKLTNRLERIHRNALVNMSDAEYEADKKFRHSHWIKHGGPEYKAVGNTYRYELTGTGVGVIITVTCPICGESENITDYDNW